MNKRNRIIAIDGFSSCGKSTFAKSIAKELGLLYIDSGAMYRAVTLYAMREGWASTTHLDQEGLTKSLKDIEIDFKKGPSTGKNETFLNGENVEEEIRGIEVSQIVSPVSKIREVREKMVDLQRKFSKKDGVVMDGRDIGTVVFPNADLKIFMTASLQIRAKRRYDELTAKGLKVSMEEIKSNIEDRDRQDSTRTESPLKKASDAIELDNSYMTPGEQMTWFHKIIESRFD